MAVALRNKSGFSGHFHGVVKTYEAIVKGQNIPTPGVPESFKVLVKELQSLALDVRVLDENGEEIELSQIGEDDLEVPNYVSDEDDSEFTEDELGESIAPDDLFDSFTDDDMDDEPTDEQFEADIENGLDLDGFDSDF